MSKQNVNTMEKGTLYFDESGKIYPFQVQSKLSNVKLTGATWSYWCRYVEVNHDTNVISFFLELEKDSVPLRWDYNIHVEVTEEEFDIDPSSDSHYVTGYALDYIDIGHATFDDVDDFVKLIDCEASQEEAMLIEHIVDKKLEY